LALGQFLTYRVAMAHHDPERRLYLAIPLDAYEQVFLGPMARRAHTRF
jgi:hypothetical protein